MGNTTQDTLNKLNGSAPPQFTNIVQGLEKPLEQLSQNLGEKAGTMASNLATSTSDYVKTGREYVKENPAKGIAIAAAAGVILGSLLTLGLRRRQP